MGLTLIFYVTVYGREHITMVTTCITMLLIDYWDPAADKNSALAQAYEY